MSGTSAPKFIGKRITVVRSKEDIVVTISQQIERWQEALLVGWLLAWTFCGVVFIKYAIETTIMSDRVFFVIASSLWAYFFVKIIKVYMWRKGGREIIRISKGKLEIMNAYWKRALPETFLIGSIFKLGLIKRNPGNFLAFLDDSFWIIGGEKVGFSHSGTKIRVGKQLSDKDAELLIRVIESGMKEFGKA
ncbi:MAG: hypothetical protein ACOVMR_09695 [Flavobacteriales bacterium]|jgi:hypothetical protein